MKTVREIFREYDIRGLAETELSSELAEHLGRALGTLIKGDGGKKVVLGRDHRASGGRLLQHLSSGFRACGLDVVDVGVVPTPVQYWAIQHLGADGGVMVTGSHNPKAYNGFKMTLAKRPLFGSDIQALREAIEAEDYVDDTEGPGKYHEEPVLEPYLKELEDNLSAARGRLKIVVDAGNGTGGITAIPLLERLGHEVVALYCEPDGDFPNHHPDPTVEENLEDLKVAVEKHQADLGLAFDGDADRIGVIDQDGSVIWGDRLMILLAQQVLRAEPGATIIGEVKCSKTMYDAIREAGGQALMWKAGHSLIKAKMKEEGAALAGEMSGHIFFKHRYYGFDDALYASGRLIEILLEAKQSAGELLADIPILFSTPEIRVECPEDKKFDVVNKVVASFKVDSQGAERVVDVDGVRVEWPDGWGLVRPSNTQAILVLRFEANSQERLDEIRALFDARIAASR